MNGSLVRAIPATASPQRFEIEFRDCSEEPPAMPGVRECSALIVNQCDGYHHVFARWEADGEFSGFYDFCGTDRYEPDRFFCAWAILPDTLVPELRKFARQGPAPD